MAVQAKKSNSTSTGSDSLSVRNVSPRWSSLSRIRRRTRVEKPSLSEIERIYAETQAALMMNEPLELAHVAEWYSVAL